MFRLDGKTPAELGVALLRGHEHSILPRTDDRLVSVSGRHGSWDFGADLRVRDFTLPLEFVGCANRQELQDRIRAFAAFLVDAHGNPRTMRLTFDTEPGLFYNVRYSGRLPVKRLMESGQFDLPLVAVEPWAQAVEETVVVETITESPQEIPLEVGGTLATPAVITIKNIGSQAITSLTIELEQEVE